MLKRVTLVVIALAGIVPGIGLALSGVWPLALACAAMGGLWLYGYRHGWDGLASLLLVGFIIPAAIGVGLSGGAVWAPLAVVLALAAWDLHRFTGRMVNAGAYSDETRVLERRHLVRLLAVSGLGLVLSWTAVAIRLKLGMAVALALGFLAILGLSQLVQALARESD
jgi:hypothetical protein